MRSTTPIHSRINSVRPYNELLQPDATVTILRRQLNESRGLEYKFEELCIEVVKAERENKRLEETHTALEQEFLEKIKLNKNTITQLKHNIQLSLQSTENKNSKIQALKEENQFLLQKIQTIENQKASLAHEREEQKNEIRHLNSIQNNQGQKLSELAIQKEKIKNEMQKKSNEVDDLYEEYKIRQIKITEADKNRLLLQKQLAQLVEKRTTIQNEQKKTEFKLNGLSIRLSNAKEDTVNLKNSAQWHQQQLNECHSTTKHIAQDLRRALLKNKESSIELTPLKEELCEASNKMYLDSVIYEKMQAKFNEVQSHNAEMFKVLKNLKNSLNCEQQIYATFIQQMKQCIVYDEKVANALNRQTQMLENITV